MSGAALPFLPYGRHCIDESDVAAVAQVLRGEWLTQGPAVQGFEDTLAARLGVDHAIAVNSGTAALHLAVLAAGLEPGDRAVVPALTFLATANAVRFAGGEVVFADVDPETGLMGAGQLSEALDRAASDGGGGPVKLVLQVHLNGQCADPPAIRAITDDRGLKLIDDSCHAIGASYDTGGGGQAAIGSCRDCDFATFSFHPVKTIAMGEGGAVTTNDTAAAARIRRLRSHAMVRGDGPFTQAELALDPQGAPNPWYYEMLEIGFNYRPGDLHCALGRSQLAKLDDFVAARRTLAARYDEVLAPLAPLVAPVARRPECSPAWHLYVVMIDFEAAGVDRARVVRGLRDRGIGTQVHYLPVCHQPYYRDRHGAQTVPGADRYYARALSLPLFVGMTVADVERVVDALQAVLA